MLLKGRLFAAEKIFRTNHAPPAIAFLDTGLSPVADFTEPNNRIIAFLDLINGRTMPYDDNGHGTHVTGAKNRFFCYFAVTKNPACFHRRGLSGVLYELHLILIQ